MLQRLYVHNFRCLENFELVIKETPSALLIGKNGAGKSTIRAVFEVLQAIARGNNKMSELESLNLIGLKDFSCGRANVPIRFEIETLINGEIYKYAVAFDLPENFKELRIFEETLIASNKTIYHRKEAQIIRYNYKTSQNNEIQFLVDWHQVVLPIIQTYSDTDPVYILRTWLRNMVILSPIPSLMTGDSEGETLEVKKDGSNFGEWFSGLYTEYPDAYQKIKEYLQDIMPDIASIRNERVAKNAKNLLIQFKQESDTVLNVPFDTLSDGEKCFFLCAVVLAANEFYGPLFCFWDEPDNFISIAEVGHFIMALRRSFQGNSQILVTSHNYEVIRKFSNENTFVLGRKSHLEPTLIKSMSDLKITDDILNTLILDDLDF